MEYTFYKISHTDYPELVYIGSTKNYTKRRCYHKSACYNETSKNFNIPLYQFIRINKIPFEDLQFEILNKPIYENKESVYKWERFLIESFDTIENGMNENLPYITTEEKKELKKQYYKQTIVHLKEYQKQYRERNKERKKQNNKQYREQNRNKINEKFNCDICNKLMIKRNIARHKRHKHS